MTKVEFFKYCDGNNRRHRLFISQDVVPRSLESAVFLNGCFHNGTVTTIQLYRPFAGRQWTSANRIELGKMLDKAVAKFERWLKEWKVKQRSLHDDATCGCCGGPLEGDRDAICYTCCPPDEEPIVFFSTQLPPIQDLYW